MSETASTDPSPYPQEDWQGHALYHCPQEGCGYRAFSPGKMAAHVAARHPGLGTPPVSPPPSTPDSTPPEPATKED